jgi:hypothetical protein
VYGIEIVLGGSVPFWTAALLWRRKERRALSVVALLRLHFLPRLHARQEQNLATLDMFGSPV